jgi:acetyl-CoA synthetase
MNLPFTRAMLYAALGLALAFTACKRIRTKPNTTPTAYAESVKDPGYGLLGRAGRHLQWHGRSGTPICWNGISSRPEREVVRGGKLNITENCLDRHLVTRGNKLAMIWEPNDPQERFMRLHLPRAAREGVPVRQRAEAQRREEGRPCLHLHAHDPRAGDRRAGLRAHRGHPLAWCSLASAPRALRPHPRRQCTIVLTSDGLNRGHKQIPVKRVVDEALEQCPSVKKVIVTDRLAGP